MSINNGTPPPPFADEKPSSYDPRFSGGPGQPYGPANGQVNGTAAPRQPRGGGVSQPGGTRTQNLSQIVQSLGSSELANQDDLHQFCENYRALLNFLAITAKLAEGQLKAAARAQARNAKDGWMNPAQRFKLGTTLRLIGRDLDQMANSCAAGGVSAVKAWRRFEGFLDDLETGGNKNVRRPGGRSGGFTVV